jgi:hypothetical protein
MASVQSESVAHDTAVKLTPSEPSPPTNTNAQALVDRALDFLANASNETLIACLIGLAASTWLVLGRVGLLLIGVAGGVVLHATWEKGTFPSADPFATAAEERRRRELGIEVVSKVLRWRSEVDEEEGKADDNDLMIKLHSGKTLDFSDYRPETAKALNALVDAVMRDYVK